MPCSSPLRGYRSPDGKFKVVSKGAYYDLPTVPIACGQCVLCRLKRSSQWALRCMHEVQMQSESGKGSSFITLTYDEKSVPSNYGLDVRDWQLFAKKLRKRVGSFRFFMCGEYGEQTLRPHYHALLFGVDFYDDRIPIGSNEFGDKHYISPLLTDTWSKGHCVVGAVSWQSAAYVARYIMKKVTGTAAGSFYERVDPVTGEVFRVRPEFCTMSRRPGLGDSWFRKYAGDVFPSDEVIFDGKHVSTPPYYDRKIPEAELESIKLRRKERALKYKDALTPERLEARAEIMRLTARSRK